MKALAIVEKFGVRLLCRLQQSFNVIAKIAEKCREVIIVHG
jgi:hypothetical protein